MTPRKVRSQRGASLLEVMIVLSVSALLAGLAVTQLAGAKGNLTRQNIAREFKNSLERARFDSVKRRAGDEANMAAVTVVNATSYIVTTDQNQNGFLESAESQHFDFASRSDVRLLLPPGNTAPVSIAFDQRGHANIEDYDGNSVEYFLFCGTGCTSSNANSSNSSVIFLSPTGTATLIGGGESQAAVSDPELSEVAPTSGINSELTVWVGSPPSPSPTTSPIPTATPTASPTATPTSSPTATGTATATATPTASPSPTPLRSCGLNERPGSPPSCQCVAPWFIGKNGKCGP